MFSIISLNSKAHTQFIRNSEKIAKISLMFALMAGFLTYNFMNGPGSFLPKLPLAGYVISGISLLFFIDAIRYALLFKKSPSPLSLVSLNRSLRQLIQSTSIYVDNPKKNLQSIYTPVHSVFEGVYLGNYRAFLSVDPKFIKKYSTVETQEELTNVGLDISPDLYRSMKKGCSEMNIKLIISITQFQPSSSVAADDWSRFTPDLETLHVKRIQVRAHDDDDAWSRIEPELDHIFSEIDQARLSRQNVLIHCVEGSSRSSAVLYAYLMNRCNVSLDEAFNFVRSHRHHVQIKPAMSEGLRKYQAKLQTRASL